MDALTDNKVYEMKGVDRMNSMVQGSQDRHQSSKPLTMAESMERLDGDVTQQSEQFERFTDYQYTCNITLGEMMRQLAVGMAVDMTEFPTMPGYLE